MTQSLEQGPEARESQTRYWISSLSPEETSAERMGRSVRDQWNIENGSHRQRDTLWREDAQRFKHHGRAHVLASLRQVMLWVLTTAVSSTPSGKGRPIPTSHKIHRFTFNLASAIPYLTKDCRE